MAIKSIHTNKAAISNLKVMLKAGDVLLDQGPIIDRKAPMARAGGWIASTPTPPQNNLVSVFWNATQRQIDAGGLTVYGPEVNAENLVALAEGTEWADLATASAAIIGTAAEDSVAGDTTGLIGTWPMEEVLFAAPGVYDVITASGIYASIDDLIDGLATSLSLSRAELLPQLTVAINSNFIGGAYTGEHNLLILPVQAVKNAGGATVPQINNTETSAIFTSVLVVLEYKGT